VVSGQKALGISSRQWAVGSRQWAGLAIYGSLPEGGFGWCGFPFGVRRFLRAERPIIKTFLFLLKNSQFLYIIYIEEKINGISQGEDI